jgi:hypothetical protein
VESGRWKVTETLERPNNGSKSNELIRSFSPSPWGAEAWGVGCLPLSLSDKAPFPLKAGRRLAFAIILLAFIVTLSPATSLAGEEVLFRDDFDTLDNWEPLKFPKIDRMSSYTTAPQDNDECFVRAESDNSASGMLLKKEFSVFDYPMARWRWKVSNIYEKGDAARKKGDDYPLRIYINFKYDTRDPAVKKNLKYSLAKIFYGEYPPYRSLNYIWANRQHQQKYLENKYTSASIMIPLQAGKANTGKWVTEEVDMLADYRAAFGEDPPKIASLAFMNDSDNTGESSVSWIDWIEVFRKDDAGATNHEDRSTK